MIDYKNLNEHDLNRLAVSMVYEALPAGKINKIKATDILGQSAPYDILWDDNKLCVRVANVSTTSRFPKWNYTLKAENRETVDFYILLALRESDVLRVFVLAPDIIPETTVTISERMGQFRYQMFSTSLDRIPEKIEEVKKNLDEYRKMYVEAQGGRN